MWASATKYLSWAGVRAGTSRDIAADPTDWMRAPWASISRTEAPRAVLVVSGSRSVLVLGAAPLFGAFPGTPVVRARIRGSPVESYVRGRPAGREIIYRALSTCRAGQQRLQHTRFDRGGLTSGRSRQIAAVVAARKGQIAAGALPEGGGRRVRASSFRCRSQHETGIRAPRHCAHYRRSILVRFAAARGRTSSRQARDLRRFLRAKVRHPPLSYSVREADG
ncbi:hypothetical protein B0H17DRAFT_1054097 [Mycena rosella]|uniref:Uncharacterized protein n=1 Tax=Mycena rosella TaxID=1033263 RepID=A0AAD7GNM6_MYCRO|nr:hypothetical protein B0H17DRAFT_1054097 [Mycena rosella]